MKFPVTIFVLIGVLTNGNSQSAHHYKDTYHFLKTSLENNAKTEFSRAVFSVENAYFSGNLDSVEFHKSINELVNLAKMLKVGFTTKSDNDDKVNTYAAIFLTMTDTVSAIVNGGKKFYHPPFGYDFEDIFGEIDWSNSFVSKLLTTRKGNCHSLPFLYKIICERLNVPCHLALAPNHLYIKHKAKQGGWYNTELTSATFPIDAWLMASGYITLEAVQNGIYLDTLSEKESIALCVIDLAQGYDHKYPDNDGKFIIECCDLALKHFPDYINAMMLKAETLLRLLKQLQKDTHYTYLKEVTKLPDGKAKWDEMNALYGKMLKLGYRQMPEQMYVEWLTSLKTEKEKYTNKQALGAAKD
jgi:hypothetical protein